MRGPAFAEGVIFTPLAAAKLFPISIDTRKNQATPRFDAEKAVIHRTKV
jgi:hypothetical protein